jgi:hypothetical protein
MCRPGRFQCKKEKNLMTFVGMRHAAEEFFHCILYCRDVPGRAGIGKKNLTNILQRTTYAI